MGRASKGCTIETATPVVILVRPQLGENIGMAARAMLNCGLSQMRLVSPRDGWPNPSARRAAAGADAVLEGAQVFGTVAEAVADLQHVVATTARSRQMTQRQLTARRAAQDMRDWIGAGDSVGVLFGPERAGLENDDLDHADTTLSVPLNPQFSSLNIAQAVLLVAYEWAMTGDTGPDNATDAVADLLRRQIIKHPSRPTDNGLELLSLPKLISDPNSRREVVLVERGKSRVHLLQLAVDLL